MDSALPHLHLPADDEIVVSDGDQALHSADRKGPKELRGHRARLSGCVAVARSRREVLRLITEAIPLHLAAMVAAGEPVPPLVHEATVVSPEVEGP